MALKFYFMILSTTFQKLPNYYFFYEFVRDPSISSIFVTISDSLF
jgi:hypothetical protein